MELEKARVTFACNFTMLPSGMGVLNDTWLTLAVTTWKLSACLLATMEEIRSIRASNSPPNILLSILVSLGRTRLVSSDTESDGVLIFVFIEKDLLHRKGL